MLYHFTQHFLDALEGKKDRFITLAYQTVLTKGIVQIHDGDGPPTHITVCRCQEKRTVGVDFQAASSIIG